jgi:hypothetical protein
MGGSVEYLTLTGESEVGVNVTVPLGLAPGRGKAGWKAGIFLSDEAGRRVGAKLVEMGEIALYLDPSSKEADDLPLCLIDYSMVERGGCGRKIVVDPGGWNDACRLVGMHAVLFGLGEGVDDAALEHQYMEWALKGTTLPRS